MAGEWAFERAASAVRSLPLWGAVELVGIVLPLAFHAIVGLRLAFRTPPEVARDRYETDWRFSAQRASGVVTLLFIAFHLWEFWAQKLLRRVAPDAFYPLLAAHLSSTWAGLPVRAALYLVGIAAVSFHFANGLLGLARLFGLLSSPGRRRGLRFGAGALGFAIFLLGASTTIYFATGLSLPAWVSHTSTPSPRCSVIDRAGENPAPRPAPAPPAQPSETRMR
jgi:succinate dehydrogenase/fumarate reductase cytochrome b subunit (b558 family)